MINMDAVRQILYDNLVQYEEVEEWRFEEDEYNDGAYLWVKYTHYESIDFYIPELYTIEDLIDFLYLHKTELNENLQILLGQAIEELEEKQSELDLYDKGDDFSR